MAIVLGLASSQVQVQERKAVCMQESHGLGFGPARAGVEPAFNEESDCVWSLTADHSQAPPPSSLCASNLHKSLRKPGGSLCWGWLEGQPTHTYAPTQKAQACLFPLLFQAIWDELERPPCGDLDCLSYEPFHTVLGHVWRHHQGTMTLLDEDTWANCYWLKEVTGIQGSWGLQKGSAMSSRKSHCLCRGDSLARVRSLNTATHQRRA